MTPALCIGGPLDGCYRSSDRDYFVAHAQIGLKLPAAPFDPMPVTSATVEHTVYRLERLRANALVIEYWRPEQQTVEYTMTMLIQGYRSPPPAAREGGGR